MTKTWILPIVALTALAACAPQQTPKPQATQAVPVPEPDREAAVVNAAAAFFFVKDNGLDEQWSKGDFVVLQGEWAGGERSDNRTFRELLTAMMDGSDFRLLAVSKEKRPLVEQVLESAGDAADPADVSNTELKSLELEERIVLDESDGRLDYLDKDYVNKAGKRGKARAVGSVERPTFSPNLRYALVRMQIRWSVHGGPVIMVLEKKEDGWEVVYSDYTIWL